MGRVIMLLIGLTVVCIFARSLVELDPFLGGPFNRLELLPYLALFGVMLVFILYQIWKTGGFVGVHPFVYFTALYIGPILFGGSLLYVLFGISDVPDSLIVDPSVNYRLSLVYTTIAVASLALGTNTRVIEVTDKRLDQRVPALNITPRNLMIPGLVFMTLGVVIQYINFRSGLIGYQISDIGRFTALFYYLGLCFQFGLFLVVSALLQEVKFRWLSACVVLLTVIAILLCAMLAGSRGFIFSCWIVVAFSFLTTGPEPTIRRLSYLLILGFVSLAVGFAVGTVSRDIKSNIAVGVEEPASDSDTSTSSSNLSIKDQRQIDQSEQSAVSDNPTTSSEFAINAQRRVDLREQYSNFGMAVSTILTDIPGGRLIRAFAARVNVITHLAVIVSKQDIPGYELPTTIKSGILLGVVTAVVPRSIWQEKPVIGDTAGYALHFFQFEGNSFAVTPYVDLLVNFGPAGIVPGMFILGLFLRFIQDALWAPESKSVIPAAIYMMLLTQTSLEGLYATIFPHYLRIIFVAILLTAGTIAMVWLVRRIPTSIGYQDKL